MDSIKIEKKDFLAFIDGKISAKRSRILGVVKRDSHYRFSEIQKAEELKMDYDVTILPPKKYFLPTREILLRFRPRDANSYQAVCECPPITIIGIHYYDLAGIYMLDRAFSEGVKDHHYLKKREKSLLIGLFPTKAFKYRFSSSVVKDQYYQVADLMMVDMGKEFVIEVVSHKGKAFLSGSKMKKSNYSLKEIEEAKNRITDYQKLPIAKEISGDYLTKNYKHAAWKYYGERCFSCGSCALVCPTCYCFDVQEELSLDLKTGQRVRTWDACMLEDFARVAGDHNFRKDAGSRFRHRMFRKVKYLTEKFHYYGCVGCGRCAQACTADIAGPAKVFKYLLEN